MEEEPGRLQSMGSRRVGHDFTFTFHFYALEKEMATHSSVLAWRIPRMGSHRVWYDWSDLAVAAAVPNSWVLSNCLLTNRIELTPKAEFYNPPFIVILCKAVLWNDTWSFCQFHVFMSLYLTVLQAGVWMASSFFFSSFHLKKNV